MEIVEKGSRGFRVYCYISCGFKRNLRKLMVKRVENRVLIGYYLFRVIMEKGVY